LFPSHLSFILHGALVGAGTPEVIKRIGYGMVFVVIDLLLFLEIPCLKQMLQWLLLLSNWILFY
jgi:hypothetical protein